MITKIVRNFGAYLMRFYVETVSEMTPEEMKKLLYVVAETFEPNRTGKLSSKGEDLYLEIGPRLSVETPFSTNAVAICHSMGLKKVTRIEASRLYVLKGTTKEEILAKHLDKMTQVVYPIGGIESFNLNVKPAEMQIIPVLEQGEKAIREANKRLGLGMDDWDISYYTNLFIRCERNPTDVELFQIGNANSEHSRHWFFRGIQEIDGVKMKESLFDIIQSTLFSTSRKDVSILAFNDNVGALRGHNYLVLNPNNPGNPSMFVLGRRLIHVTATAETHNHPTLVAPFSGAATGSGGRIRDNSAGGRGSLPGMGVAGYCVGNLFIPGYKIPGEEIGGEVCDNYASPLKILIDGSNGVSSYGNEFGEPLIGGFTRTFGQNISGERREFRKPILYSGGIGHIDDTHTKKHNPEKGMLIVAIGGPAYAIGEGGGAASSMMQGQNDAGLDFKSVQRGNGEMGNKAVRVIRACVEMGEKNPIESIHDQGAGGPSNVLTELMGEEGGIIDIKKIVLGDKTMSELSIWSAEYQERYGLLIKPENAEIFKNICIRERVNCEILGEITCDGYVTVINSANDTTPVRLNLEDILGKLPQKIFKSDHDSKKFNPLVLPKNLTLQNAIEIVLKLLSVGSKGFLIHKVDRDVGGLVGQQQCCGKTQIPIANIAVMADSFFGLTGAVTAIGEQPIKMMIDPKAGARMSVGEMLTNMMSAGGINLSEIRVRANWMWPAKLPNEGALLYDAAVAMRDIMVALDIACDGGKDSLSMAATVNGELVKAPGQLVVLGYASMPDITKVLTPDIKAPGKSKLGLIDLGLGKNRLGGSALAQAFNQIGDESPDCDPKLLKATWKAIQLLHDSGAILSLHDRSDGGLITTVIEMCLGGNSGFLLNDEHKYADKLFSEELGIVIEYLREDEERIRKVLKENGVPFEVLGMTTCDETSIFSKELTTLRKWWESTSHELEKLQTKNGVADEEFLSYERLYEPVNKLSFTPSAIAIKENDFRPKVAILREEGSNGDREMSAAFYTAGLNPFDITMSDLLAEKISLDEFQGLVAVGGFSYMDVFDSAKGWAGAILHNPKLKEMFDRFYEKENTFSLGVCNGCQLFALLGWVPFKGLRKTIQPRFIHNLSGRFESRWVQVKIEPSPAILFKDMAGSTLGVNIAHGEGKLFFPNSEILEKVLDNNLAPLVYVNPNNNATEIYPFNPNGSGLGIAALCSADGRHLAMMPHPERSFLKWQLPFMPESWRNLKSAPWLKMFTNARDWCLENK